MGWRCVVVWVVVVLVVLMVCRCGGGGVLWRARRSRASRRCEAQGECTLVEMGGNR